MAIPDILNEKLADSIVNTVLQRERVNIHMPYVISNELVKTVDGRIINIGEGIVISEDELAERIKEAENNLNRLQSFVKPKPAEPVQPPVPNQEPPEPVAATEQVLEAPQPPAPQNPPVSQPIQ